MNVIESDDVDDLIKYEGLLMPGMVNAHCHLELSHLRSQVEEGSGLLRFLLSVVALRDKFTPEEKLKAIEHAETEMISNGIVAVGDICNTLDTLMQKSKSSMDYHSFAECFGLREEKAQEIVNAAKIIQHEFSMHHQSSVVLHAPYSISQSLIREVDNESSGRITCIHNQESAAENQLFLNKTGDFLQLLEAIHFDKNDFSIEYKTSLQTYLPKFIHQQKVILVHNTFTEKDDLDLAAVTGKDLYWCLCPNANLYIENALPDIELLMNNQCTIVLGTDSLASNHHLSIWEEMRTIHRHKPEIPVEAMLKWATGNGAKALGMDYKLGSFEKGKLPGIIQVSGFAKAEEMMTDHYHIQRIF